MEQPLTGAEPVPLRGALAEALRVNRAALNQAFAAARLAYPELNGDDLLWFMRRHLAPVADAVAGVRPVLLGACVEALYRFILPLVAGRWLGPLPRDEVLQDAFVRGLAGLPRFTAEAPERFAAALINALYNLRQFPQARAAAWAEALVDAGPHCADLPALLACGQVLAWTRGLAHYRDAALAVLATLPAGLAGSLLGSDSEMTPAMLARLCADPWYLPGFADEPRPRVVARVGGFRGFVDAGGPLARPPVVTVESGQWLADDGESVFVFHADVFGSTWHRQGASVGLAATHAVDWPRIAGLAEVAGARASARNGTTLAAALPWSHEIVLVALADG